LSALTLWTLHSDLHWKSDHLGAAAQWFSFTR
jgi:hypothetical protein